MAEKSPTDKDPKNFKDFEEFFAAAIAVGQFMFKERDGQQNPSIHFHIKGLGTAAVTMNHRPEGDPLVAIIEKVMRTPYDYFCVILHMGFNKETQAGIEYLDGKSRNPILPEGLAFFGGDKTGFLKSRLYPVVRNKHGHVKGFSDFLILPTNPQDLR